MKKQKVYAIVSVDGMFQVKKNDFGDKAKILLDDTDYWQAFDFVLCQLSAGETAKLFIATADLSGGTEEDEDGKEITDTFYCWKEMLITKTE